MGFVYHDCQHGYMILFNGWRLLTSVGSGTAHGMAYVGDPYVERGGSQGGGTGGGQAKKDGGRTWVGMHGHAGYC